MGLMKKLTSVVVTAGLLLGLVGTAAAAYPDGVAAAAGRMHDLGLVNGKVQGSTDLQLNDPITRAELVTIIVRAFGKANDAKFLKGAAAFPDTASHWASGEIALAKNMIEANGFSMGMPDGTFAPDAKLTTAQAVAFVMKFLGAPRDASQAWPNDYLNGAVAAGLMSADDKAALEAVANNDANRGLAFYLADEAFYSYKMADGKTVYTEFVKPTAPTVTLDSVAPTTKATATVSGSVSSDATAVYVGSMANQVTVTAGKFSADVDLTMGDNNISVMATDLAGNTTTKTLTITRTVGAAASIDAPATLTVKAGDTVDLAAAVKDADGNTISDAVLTATGDAGTLADGKFTAATKAGDYTLTLTSGDLTATVAVTVTAGDIASIAVTPATVNLAAGAVQKFAAAGVDQYGNSVDLSSVTWSASAGVIDQSGNFAGTGAGNITVTATSGESSGTATATVYGAAAAVKVAYSGTLIANGNTTGTVTATVVDANGNPVPNATNTITFTSSNSAIVSVATAQVQAVNGVATTEVDSTSVSGSAYITAAASGLTAGNVLVSSAGQTLTKIYVKVDPVNMAVGAGSATAIKLYARDQNNVSMPAPASLTVQLTSSNTQVAAFGGAATTTATIAAGSTNTTVTLNAGSVPGSAALSGVVTTAGYTTLPVDSSTVTTAPVGAAYKLAIDPISYVAKVGDNDYQTVKVRIQDYNGNQVTADNTTSISLIDPENPPVLEVSSSTSLTTDGTGNAVVPLTAVNGQATFYVKSQTADDFTMQAISGTMTPASVSFTFDPGPATQVSAFAARPNDGATTTTATIANDGVSNAVLGYYIEDQYGNVVNSNAAVTLVRTSTTAPVTTMPATVTANANAGYVAFTVTAGNQIGTSDTYKATAVGLTDSANLTVTPQNVGAAVKLIDMGGNTTRIAGQTATERFAVADQAGKVVSSDNGRQVTLTIVSGTGTISTPTATTQNGFVTFSVGTSLAGTVTMQASAPGLYNSSVTKVLTVSPAFPTQMLISASPAALTAAASGSTSSISVYAVDAYGNKSAIPAALGTPSVTLTLSGTTTGSFGGGTPTTASVTFGAGTNVTSSAVYTATGNVGTNVITATSSFLASTTKNVDTVTAGVATRLQIADITSALVGSASATGTLFADSTGTDTQRSLRIQSVVAKVTDNSGIQVTNSGLGGRAVRLTPSANVYVFDPTVDFTVAANVITRTNWKEVGPTGANGTYIDGALSNSGQVTFHVMSPSSSTKTFSAAIMNGGVVDTNYTAASAAASYTADTAKQVLVSGSPNLIAADGQALSLITGKVTDEFGNTVTSASGTMTFGISTGNDFATLQSNSASIASGVAAVYLQAKSVYGTVTVTGDVAGLTQGTNTVKVGSGAQLSGAAISLPVTIRSAATAPAIATRNSTYDVSALTTPTLVFTGTDLSGNDANRTVTFTGTPAIRTGSGAATLAATDPSKNTITITVDSGTSTPVQLSADTYATAADMAANIQLQINNSSLAGKVTVSADGTGKLVFTTAHKGSGATLTVVGDATLGLAAAVSTASTGNVANVAAVTATELQTLVAGVTGLNSTGLAGNVLTLTSASTGSTSNIAVSGNAASVFFATTSAVGGDINNQISISVNGTPYANKTIANGTYTVADGLGGAGDLLTALNTAITGTGATFTMNSSNQLVLTTNLSGYNATLSIDTQAANSAYSVLGLSVQSLVHGK